MQKSTGIHCKVICNDQIRRFQFSGTEFSSLQDQVKKLLGLNNEFVLKYKDNEGDMITISSTEELACAIDISHKTDGGLIRLSVFSEPTPVTVAPTPTQPQQTQEYGFPAREFSCPRGRGRWGGRGGGRWCREGGASPQTGEFHCKNRIEKRRAKLTFKKDMFKAYLSTLEGKELTPEEERRKQMYQTKVQRLETILNEWFGSTPPNQPPKNDSPVVEKTEVPVKEPVFVPPIPGDLEKEEFFPQREGQNYPKKFNKKERKGRRKEMKKEKKLRQSQKSLLSEDDRAELMSLKSQIKELKPAVWALQDQLKAKNSEISLAYETGQLAGVPELKNEIRRLKQEKRAKKAQIEPLRQRVHQLKGK